MFLFFVCAFIGFMGKEAIFTDKNMNLNFFNAIILLNKIYVICLSYLVYCLVCS